MRRSHSAGVDLMFKAMHQAEASGTSNLSSYSSESKLNDLAHGDVDHHLHNIRTG